MSATRVPETGLFRDVKHRYYWNGEGPYPGVTTVIRALDKPAIIEWAKRETARCAVDNYDLVGELIARGGPKAAADWLKSIPDYIRDTAGDLGSGVHEKAEAISRSQEVTVPVEQIPYVTAYRRFLTDYAPDFISLERYVFSEKGYGGTYDWLARMVIRNRKVVVLGDTKTSKDVYPEISMQLAALGNADWIGLPEYPKKYPIPKIDTFAVLHIRPDKYARGYRLIEYRVGPDEYDAFLACLRLTNWKATNASVIGETIPMPVQEKAA
jgi:hypothetical protein